MRDFVDNLGKFCVIFLVNLVEFCYWTYLRFKICSLNALSIQIYFTEYTLSSKLTFNFFTEYILTSKRFSKSLITKSKKFANFLIKSALKKLQNHIHILYKINNSKIFKNFPKLLFSEHKNPQIFHRNTLKPVHNMIKKIKSEREIIKVMELNVKIHHKAASEHKKDKNLILFH